MMSLRPSLVARAVAGVWLQTCEDAPLHGVSIDSREAQPGSVFLAVQGANHDGHDFARAAVQRGASLAVVERDIDLTSLPGHVGVLRVASTRAALMQLAGWFRSTFTNTTVIAVTGSSGKTTTRQLIDGALGAALTGIASPKSFNNDLGVPLSLLAARPEHRYAVIEVGINAVGEMQPLADVVRPDVAVMTNIGDSHLEGLHDVQTVAREKLRLLSSLAKDGVAILHADSPALREAARSHANSVNVIWFGESMEAQVRLADRGVDEHGPWLALADGARFRISLSGKHNAVNALAAIAVARHLGLTDETISKGLSDVAGLPMRMQEQMIHGIRIINDAYNANPQSMIAGVETFLESTTDEVRRVLVLGDMCELGAAGPSLHECVGKEVGDLLAGASPCVVHTVGELASRNLTNGLRERLPDAVGRSFSDMTPATADEIAASLEPGDAMFIKGSRAMALERLLPVIERRFAREQRPAARALGVI
jgi:UDP-N-acetylmuramoyl-tripeptide--D-alanyl-D-alanine ligase